MDRARLESAARQALALLVPVECVGCGRPDAAVCVDCAAGMAGMVLTRALEPGFRVWAGTEYTGAARRAILALKNDQRTDAAAALSPVLLAAIGEAVDALGTQHRGTLSLAALPSSRAAYRRRGYRPVDVLVARSRLHLDHPLAWRRQPGDQIGLGVAARRANLTGALRARGTVDGRRFLLVDDVVTTGETLREARRALAGAGGQVLGAAVLAATPRHRTPRPPEHFC